MVPAPKQNNGCCAICNSLPYALLVIDDCDRIIAHNQAFLNFLPLHPPSVYGESLSELITHELTLAGVRRVQDTHTGEELSFIWPGSDGNSRFVRALITPLTGKGWIQLMLEDLSERMRLHAMLIDSEQFEGMQQLAQVVAHDLGGALGIIWHAVGKLKEDIENQALSLPLDPLLEKGLGRIENLRRKMSGLRMQRRPPLEPIDIYQQIDDSLFTLEEDIERRGVKIVFRLTDSPPRCQANGSRMRQVFLNLFRNALEAMPSGGTLDICSHVAGDRDPECLVVEVRDTGTGMSGDELAVAFKPLSSNKPNSTGLGLPFCRQILAAFEGEIEINSREGEGTTVTVTIPTIKD